MSIYTIGQVAKRSNTTVEAIRFYEKETLLEAPKRLPNGYRQYPEKTIVRMRFIQNAKDAGFTLKEIKELLSISENAEDTCADIKDKVMTKLISVDEKIEALKVVKRTLNTLANQCEGTEASIECPIVDEFANQERIQ